MNKVHTALLFFISLAMPLLLFSMQPQSPAVNFATIPKEIFLNICAKMRGKFPWEALLQVYALKKVSKMWYAILSDHEIIAFTLHIPLMHCAAAMDKADEIVKLKMEKRLSLLEPDELGYIPGDYAKNLNKNKSLKTLQIARALRKKDIRIVEQHQYTVEDLINALVQDNIDHVETILFQKVSVVFDLIKILFPLAGAPDTIANRSTWSERCKQRILYAAQGMLELDASVALYEQESTFTDLYREILYSYHANINAYHADGLTLLHKACGDPKKIAIVRWLLKCEGIEVNSTCKGNEHYAGDTPLHIAAVSDNNEAIEALFATKVCNVHAVNNRYGETALHHAVSADNTVGIQLLIRNNADVHSKNKTRAATPLHYAARQDTTDSLAALCTFPDCHIDIKDKFGRTPLAHAVMQGRNLECMHYLLDKKADIATRDMYGNTLLHNAILYDKNHSFQQLLVSTKNAANSKNNQGKTALDLAKEYGHHNMVERLMHNT
jgi:ankyrin repeat protein